MKNKKGFTLIEILIAMSIISLIAMAFFSFMNSSIKLNTKNDKDIKSLNIAQSEIENLREQIKDGRGNNLVTMDNKVVTLNGTTNYDKNNQGTIYEIKLIIKENKGLYNIDIEVKPKDDYFSKRTVNLVTQVFEN